VVQTTANDRKQHRDGEVSDIDITVTYLYGDALEIETRGHHLTVDQPVEDGGADLGPTPTELFVASLAACVGFYASRFLRRHDLPSEGLTVRCDATLSSDLPTRVAAITLVLDGLPPLPEKRRAALAASASRCLVHNSILQAPEIRIELAAPPGAAAS
jgi:uncharacterized OsmC-like protein